jgi:hypothetical protein
MLVIYIKKDLGTREWVPILIVESKSPLTLYLGIKYISFAYLQILSNGKHDVLFEIRRKRRKHIFRGKRKYRRWSTKGNIHIIWSSLGLERGRSSSMYLST